MSSSYMDMTSFAGKLVLSKDKDRTWNPDVEGLLNATATISAIYRVTTDGLVSTTSEISIDGEGN